MQVSKIQNFGAHPNFKAENKSDYENPISRNTERNLAVWTSLGGSVAAGVVLGGLTTCFIPRAEKEALSLKNSKWAIIVGLATTAISLAYSLPSKLYNTKVNAFVKQKEMDVFSRDRELKSNLTEEVHKEVKNDDVTLDKKLDDAVKLSAANGNAAVLVNANTQPQA